MYNGGIEKDEDNKLEFRRCNQQEALSQFSLYIHIIRIPIRQSTIGDRVDEASPLTPWTKKRARNDDIIPLS